MRISDWSSDVCSSDLHHGQSSIYEGAFIEHDERAKLSPVDETEQREMPDPEQARAAVEMVMATLFDVFRDTRLEPFASDPAWGFVRSEQRRVGEAGVRTCRSSASPTH